MAIKRFVSVHIPLNIYVRDHIKRRVEHAASSVKTIVERWFSEKPNIEYIKNILSSLCHHMYHLMSFHSTQNGTQNLSGL